MGSLKDKLFGKGNAFNTRLLKKKEAPKASTKPAFKPKSTKKSAPMKKSSGGSKSSLPSSTSIMPKARPVNTTAPNPINKYGNVAGGLNRPLQKGEIKEKKSVLSDPGNKRIEMPKKVETSKPMKGGSSAVSKRPFMRDTETLNTFRQKESRRASDEATGKANAPKVKRAIGKFMLGKGYKG